MRVNRVGVFGVAGLVTAVILTNVPLVLAQGAFGTFNGRVLDQEDAVMPGVTITATKTNTNVARTSVTNREGLYNLPGLEPGVYEVKAELSGFATTTRTGLTLAVNETITVDLKLGVGGLSESITVAGVSPLVETTQSVVSATILTREVVNLPLLTRNLNGLLDLLPGAKPVAPLHPLKRQWGSVAFGGSTGRNSLQVVDGADNRDNIVGGPLLNYTVEGIEEFRIASHQFSAADGRTGGSAVTVLTKSGTNTLKGSGFFLARDRSMTAKDYFTARDNLTKLPYSRQQFGGSVGGPIVRNRAFFFGAIEKIREDTAITVPDRQYNELRLLVPFGAQPAQKIDKPYRELLYTIKGNVQLSPDHALIVRFYHQKGNGVNGEKTAGNDLSGTHHEDNTGWDAVAQHAWVLGSNALNQFSVHTSRFFALNDYDYYFRDWPAVSPLPAIGNLSFPSVTIGQNAFAYDVVQDLWQIRNDLTLQFASHALKMGGDYSWMPNFGTSYCRCFASFSFFDDPSVIVSNSNGRYPQGFQTAGAMSVWRSGAPAGIKASNNMLDGNVFQVKAYIQDDWRVLRNLTLNLGVRYDVDANFFDEANTRKGLTGQVLRAIGSPYGEVARTPKKDVSPRVGFAYDFSGTGERVLRGGYGMYFDGTGINAHTFSFVQNDRPYIIDRQLLNSTVGIGELASYRFGIDPLPPQPPAVTALDGRFPPGANSGGYWLDPNIKHPRNHQMHIGYSHGLGPSTVISADYTRVKGLNDLKNVQINTFVNGVRRLAPDLARVYGDPNLLGAVQIESSIGRSRYDELAVQFQRRLPRTTLRVNYTLAGAFAYGGAIVQSAALVPASQDADNIFAPGEWGPTVSDERHRVVVFGVLDLPGGLQVSPIFQVATPRPYNLIAGSDLNADGQANDRYVDPATGQQVSVNSQRGDPFWLVDARVTKTFGVGRENRKLSLFAEFFNVFNTVNFGQSYNGNGRSVLFKTPTGFIPGSGFPFQVQLGGRFEF